MTQAVEEQKKIGVLLVNLGTPEAPTYGAIRRYLSEFLSDKRVIEMPSFLWQPILQGFILTFRPHRVAKAYARIWNQQVNKSPLSVITEQQAQQLQARFKDKSIYIDWAMCYGKPAIEQKIYHFMKQGYYHLIILPLYPQYSATTTATVHDRIFKILLNCRKQPALRTLFSFADDPSYIQALQKQIEKTLNPLMNKPERILLSFHGLPQAYVDKGDPYEKECQKTAINLRQVMHQTEEEMPIVYQSRFGPSQWLEPNIVDVIKQLAWQGIKYIAVMAPGFMADCLETLDEINHEYRQLFVQEGGEEFTYIPCLNDQEYAIDMLEALISRELKGWYDGKIR